MAFKVGGCAGHGGYVTLVPKTYATAGKRTPDGEPEWTFNDKVIRAFEDELLKYENVEFMRFDDRTGKTDVPLKTRTDGANAWGADIYISFHHNANTGKWGTWTGTETFTQTGVGGKAVELAKLVQPAIVEAYGLRDRGLKTANFHITRETRMPAILIEGGYMDSLIDIVKLRDDKVLENAGRKVAQAVAQYANLKKKAEVQKESSPTPQKDSADGKLVRGEQGDNVRLMIDMLRELQHTRIVGDVFNGYIENALKSFQQAHGLPVDGVYTSKVGSAMLKVIKEKREADKIKVDPIPEKSHHTYRLAKLYDTQSETLVKKLKEEGYRVIDLPEENK